MDVVLVDRVSGEAAEIARVTEVSAEEGHLMVEGYTSRFRLADGEGLPFVETELVGSCEVVNLRGEVVRPYQEPVPVVVRKLQTRFNVRPATMADRAAMSRSEFKAHLAGSFASKAGLPVKARRGIVVPLPAPDPIL